jgi:peroxiredoxin
MKKGNIIAIAGVVILIGAIAFLWFSPSGMKAAPNVTFNTLKGEAIQLSSLKGRPALVVFWATTCPGCIKEMPHLVELYEELHPQGLELIGVAMAYDPPGQVKEMIKLRQIPYTIALDSTGDAARAFGDVKLTPTSFLIDPQGRIVQQRLGEMDMPQIRSRILGMLRS